MSRFDKNTRDNDSPQRSCLTELAAGQGAPCKRFAVGTGRESRSRHRRNPRDALRCG